MILTGNRGLCQDMAQKSPGKSHREGLTLIELMAMFPTEEAATKWFESVFWNGSRCCGKCGSLKTREVPKAKPMPYWCTDCRSYFSVRTGTAIARSNIPLRKWAIAIYLCLTSLKSVSSLKLHRDIGVSQPTAWFMLHRIREAWAQETGGVFCGPVEADETYFGGVRKNMSKTRRRQFDGCGASGKTAVAGIKDRPSNHVRAKVVKNTDAETLQGFVAGNSAAGATVYTDNFPAYDCIPRNREIVKHSVGEYVRDQASTNRLESFWSILKRAHTGTFHKLSPKHLNRYVQEFAAKHDMRNSDRLAQMRSTVGRLIGRNLLYRNLVADNGLSSAARS